MGKNIAIGALSGLLILCILITIFVFIAKDDLKKVVTERDKQIASMDYEIVKLKAVKPEIKERIVVKTNVVKEQCEKCVPTVVNKECPMCPSCPSVTVPKVKLDEFDVLNK